VVIFAIAGCSGTGPASTGAETVARTFYEAIIRKDWDRAFALVENNADNDRQRFAIQAQQFRRRVGFEPDQVLVRSCREHGDAATAHVLLKGAGHLFKDVISLHKVDGAWRIVLPPRFGEQQSGTIF
jgi:hypothetical protein